MDAKQEISKEKAPKRVKAEKKPASRKEGADRRTEGASSSSKKPVPKKDVKIPELKMFGRWDSKIAVNDTGLSAYINLSSRLLPRSAGAYRRPFHKSKAHIAERLAMHMMVPGHQGKRHRITSGRFGGGLSQTLQAVEKALEIIEKKENKNPIEILVRAIENAAVREEIISYQLGSIMARDAVIASPQRRVDKTLRAIAQGAYRKSFGKKKGIENALAEELMAASRGSNESFAIKEKERIEREAVGAR